MRLAHTLLLAGIALATPATAQTPIVVVDSGSRYTSETSIAIDPTDPAHRAGGANLFMAYASADSGHTWTIDTLTSPFGVWGDPCLLFDDQGTGYYAHLSNPGAGGRWIDRIVVARSFDGGATWGGDIGIGLDQPTQQQDKAWMCCDLSHSTRRGSVYLTWTEFDRYGVADTSCHSRIRFARTMDHGATWSEPIVISDREGNCTDGDSTSEGAVPAASPNGNVSVVWADLRGILFRTSTDGGTTWGAARVLAHTDAGWDFNVSGLQRCNGLPMLASDLSDGPHRGMLYAMWSDRRAGHPNVDVMLMRSSDGGATWSAPAVVSRDSSSREHFFPTITVDQSTGHVFIFYYDRRATHGDSTEVWLSRSTDGGATFRDTRISAAPFLPTTSLFLGDYIGSAAAGGHATVLWTSVLDRRRCPILAADVTDAADTVAVRQVLLPAPRFALAQNFPNPCDRTSQTTTIPFVVADEDAGTEVTLELRDMTGRRVAAVVRARLPAGPHVARVSTEALPAGTYIYRLRSGIHVAERLMTVTR